MILRWMALACAALALTPAAAERLPLERSEQVQGNLRIEVVDLTPRFLAFYEAARDALEAEHSETVWVIDHLRRGGMSLAEIARVPEGEMAELARRVISEMLAN